MKKKVHNASVTNDTTEKNKRYFIIETQSNDRGALYIIEDM